MTPKAVKYFILQRRYIYQNLSPQQCIMMHFFAVLLFLPLLYLLPEVRKQLLEFKQIQYKFPNHSKCKEKNQDDFNN